jgi:rhamnosyltransferase
MKLKHKKKHSSSIAVLLAAYNGMAWIEEQIDSIFQQKEVDIDIYISVDISSDGTYEWCQNLATKNIRVNVLPYGDHFGGAAKNFLRLIRDVDFSTYDYVSLADQDDIWLPNKLIHAVNILQKNNIDAYSSDVIAFWSDGREKLVKKSYPQKRLDYYFESAGPGCTYVLNRDSMLLLKIFINNNWKSVNCIELHDWLIYAFFRSRDMSWYIDSEPLMLYRQHALNQVGINFGFLAYLKRIKMIRNGWYRSEVRKISEVITISNDTFNLGTWFLIKFFYQLRRQNKDAFVLLLMILFGMF